MTTDYFADNREWLENKRLFTFDYQDKEKVDLTTLSVPLKLIIFIAWLRGLRRDLVKNGLSIMMGIEGRHRVGKSTFASTIGYITDPTFWPRMEHRIIKSPNDLMREIMVIRKEEIHGAVIIIDEGGVVIPSDEYYAEWYKQLARAFQIIGYLNPFIIFCSLSRESVGAKFRKLFNYVISGSRRGNEYSKMRIYEFSYDSMFRKYKHKRPVFTIAGQDITMNHLQFGKPPAFIENRYKNISNPQKDLLLEGFADKMEQMDKPKPTGKKEVDYQKIIEHIVANRANYETKSSRPAHVILDSYKIHLKFGIKLMDASYIKKEAETLCNEKKAENAV